MKGRILIVGNSTESKLLRDFLSEKGLEVHFIKKELFSPKEIKNCDVLVYELDKREINSPEIAEKLRKLGNFNLVFLAEEIPSLEKAILFIKKGAFDLKLLSTPMEILEKTVIYALEEKRIFWEKDEFLTRNPLMLKILQKLEGVAKSNVPVLLVGESGTGKELLARYIHKASPRRNGPFVAINCAALPETLLESELFGYEKGAFSGATFSKKGKIELANGGTLFLDEITEMDPKLQTKLLRVLQEGEVDRLGGYYPVKVDVRVVSATNRDIFKEVKEGRFRTDLFYRISVITVKIPPLRERPEDVEFLTEYFFKKFCRIYNKSFKGFTKEAIEFLKTYDFPGNVRELRNMIERAVLTCQNDYIDKIDLLDPFLIKDEEVKDSETLWKKAEGEENFSFSFNPNFGINFEKNTPERGNFLKEPEKEEKEKQMEIKPLSELEKEAILKALKVTGGNKTRAAELLGITVRTLRNKLKQYEKEGIYL